MAKWIVENLGPETPLHFSAYHPDYRLKRPPTPSKILIEAYDIAKKKGYIMSIQEMCVQIKDLIQNASIAERF